MSDKLAMDELFEQRITYPDPDAQSRLSNLKGIDEQRDSLSKILSLLISTDGLKDWFEQHHPHAEAVLDTVIRRPPLVVLAGDVGSGKTELAETIGDAVARQEDIGITLLPLSLSTRGQGRVGEMTQLISTAFEYTLQEAKKYTSETGRARGGVILLVDEADALAQSREAAQMHHEDRAGVNAFIRGIDQIANSRVPAAVIMCTNRLSALDPAVRRRSAEVLSFGRPDELQREHLLSTFLMPMNLTKESIDTLVQLTGAVAEEREYGFTFSDITQRLIPSIVLDAYPAKPVSADRAIDIAKVMVPTPPFNDRT